MSNGQKARVQVSVYDVRECWKARSTKVEIREKEALFFFRLLLLLGSKHVRNSSA
jgi:hypothetical protein